MSEEAPDNKAPVGPEYFREDRPLDSPEEAPKPKENYPGDNVAGMKRKSPRTDVAGKSLRNRHRKAKQSGQTDRSFRDYVKACAAAGDPQAKAWLETKGVK